MAGGHEIAKAGWLFRESSILRKWKKAWFVLYMNGSLKYFKSQDEYEPEDTFRMKTDCLTIQMGRQCNVSPPEGVSREALFAIIGRNETWQLCGESADDAKAWQFTLDQARVISVAQAYPNAPPAYQAGRPTGAPPPYSASYPSQNSASYPRQQYPSQRVVYAYPGQRYYGSHPPPYVVQNGPPGSTTTVIYQNEPRQRYDGTDVAMGMVAGAALGSMMWSPLLFW